MVKIINQLGDVKIGRQGEAVYQRKYGEQIRRQVSPKRAMSSEAQIAHRQLYRDALTWRSNLSLPNRRYLDGYCIANGVFDSYHIPLPWNRFALKIYLQAVRFLPDLTPTPGTPIPGEKKDASTFDHYQTLAVGQAVWRMQSFTPLETYPIGKFLGYFTKQNIPGTITIGIRATDAAGKPTGDDLTSGTTNGNTLPQVNNWEWREVSITPYQLHEGVMYAIVVRAPGADSTNSFYWSATRDDTYYPRGQFGYSFNSGDTWSLLAYDSNFQVWSAEQEGAYTNVGILYVRHPALLKITNKRGELNVNGYDTLSSLDDEYLTGQVGLDVVAGDTIEATTVAGIVYNYLVK